VHRFYFLQLFAVIAELVHVNLKFDFKGRQFQLLMLQWHHPNSCSNLPGSYPHLRQFCHYHYILCFLSRISRLPNHIAAFQIQLRIWEVLLCCLKLSVVQGNTEGTAVGTRRCLFVGKKSLPVKCCEQIFVCLFMTNLGPGSLRIFTIQVLYLIVSALGNA